MDIAASVAAASAAACGIGGLQQVASLEREVLNTSLHDGFSSSPATAAAAAASSSSLTAAAAASAAPPPNSIPPHPLEIQQKRYLHELEKEEFSRAAAAFGYHSVLRLKTERELCAMTQRLPGISSSFLGVHTVMAIDDQLLTEEIFNKDKIHEEGGPLLGVHERIERAMGI
ncbi:hypothetical protein, conserved [Eimeria maxima]|uniref:Uncharacterized protein n=1 Tax=Eimeria maxima TaxID=5804 RepID=U6M617_EIMMA|nr:hypothetical protein, conserved [Eimeria maxima]CDJ58513.1 hypothetical protein, conserved [Eimeria maxima]